MVVDCHSEFMSCLCLASKKEVFDCFTGQAMWALWGVDQLDMVKVAVEADVATTELGEETGSRVG